MTEALLQHDELAINWRARHVTMVERMIGTKSGTGGSSGSEYLRSRLPLRYYPLLWGLRSELLAQTPDSSASSTMEKPVAPQTNRPARGLAWALCQ